MFSKTCKIALFEKNGDGKKLIYFSQTLSLDKHIQVFNKWVWNTTDSSCSLITYCKFSCMILMNLDNMAILKYLQW